MNKIQIYKDLLNILDEDTLYYIIIDDFDSLSYINNKSAILRAIKENSFLIAWVNHPNEEMQIAAVQKTSIQTEDHFMEYCYYNISSSVALKLLYQKFAKHLNREKIKSHPNYKSDAQFVLESIKWINFKYMKIF